MVESYEDRMRRGGDLALQAAGRFFLRDDEVHTTLRRVTGRLDELGIPHAVAGGMALVAHGYDRTTVDVDVLVSGELLPRVHAELEGRGYLPPFAGSKDLRDTETGVRIDFQLAGQFPGDGKPKPVVFSRAADGLGHPRRHPLPRARAPDRAQAPGGTRERAGSGGNGPGFPPG